ncbi:MAG: hypothetical protein ACYTGN_17620 [Planctomycetota bacterium]|jgi:hypothetical protein
MTRICLSSWFVLAALLAGSATAPAEDEKERPGQDLWRSCAACHCVPDLRIAQDNDWLKLNETTTCISPAQDLPGAREALIGYLRAKETIRPLLIDEQHVPPAGTATGRIRVPSTAGSAYLKAERKSVREGTPPKVRLRWQASEKGKTLTLPAGEFRVINYSFYRTDTQGRRWTAAGTSTEGCTQVVVKGDKEAEFDLLPEIRAHLGCTAVTGRYVLGFYMTSRANTRMSLARDGRLVNPKWIIRGSGGERIDAGDFEVS